MLHGLKLIKIKIIVSYHTQYSTRVQTTPVIGYRYSCGTSKYREVSGTVYRVFGIIRDTVIWPMTDCPAI